MSFRSKSHLIASFVVTAAVAAVPACSFAAPDAAAETPTPVETVANTPYSATFIVNANAVYVRAGPAESYYPTMKLDKGTKLKAVGMKLDWLKVVPPDGAFCYISKVHVNRVGETAAGRGRISGDAVNVRAGSSMNAMKVVTLCQLSDGDEVKIVGEQDEYFKVEPPAGKAFLYVNKQFVDPDPSATPERQPQVVDSGTPKTTPATPKTTPAVEPPKPEVANDDEHPKTTEKVTVIKEPTTSTQPSDTVARTPATQPAADDASSVEAQFEKAEAEYADASSKSVDQQPIAKLIAEYEPLAASDKLTNTLHRIAETRLSTLQLRAKAADELTSAKAAQEVIQKKRVALQVERKELEERLASQGVANYTALGELQISSLQLGSKTLYRLTDPANSRTVCYVRTDDPKFAGMLTKFVGVKGELATEPGLGMKVVTATEVANVDPAKVNRGVSATVVPPSMSGADDASIAAHLDQR